MSARLTTVTLALVALTASGCGEEEKRPAEPAEPPALSILYLEPVGGPRWEPGDRCVELGRDEPAGTVYVGVGPRSEDGESLLGWLLRPAGVCGGQRECGHLLVEVDPAPTGALVSARGATVDVAVPLGELGDDGASHAIRVSLVDDDGTPVRDAEELAVLAELTVEVAPVGGCTPGAAGSGGAGGASATEAAGGAGGD